MAKLFRKTTATRTAFFLVADILLTIIAVWLSFLMRFDGNIPERYFSLIWQMAGFALLFIIPLFYYHKLYSFSWSYVSATELLSLLKATTISFALLAATALFFVFPRSTIFISYLLVFMLLGGLRFSKRIYFIFAKEGNIFLKDRTLIVGAGDAAEQIARSILSSKDSPFYLIGFVDDNPIKQGVLIHGVKVLGEIQKIPEIVKRENIKQLIVAVPSAGDKVIKNAVELGRKGGLLKIKIAPAMEEIINGEVSLKNLKDVGVEDLLGRKEVKIETKEIENFVKDKVVLVTGAAGSIGSELCRQIARFKPSLMLLLDQDETGIFYISQELKRKFPELRTESLVADINDKDRMVFTFNKFCPKIIFHAAAYKHVPLMEQQPDEAVKNNIFGTKNLAEISVENGVEKFVLISTDKAVNPTSVMGATKRVCELICQAMNRRNKTKFISVRFGNVLNSRGSVIPTFREQIKRGGPVEVTDPEMKRYFMLTSEACLLVMQAGAMGNGGEVFVLDMGNPVKILDLAREMIKLSGFVPDRDIAIVFTGIRPGEKLFEEILTAQEGTVSSEKEKIFIAKIAGLDDNKLNSGLENLKEEIKSKDYKKIIEAIKQIVPSYK